MGTRLTLAQLAATPGPGFDQPFEMLAACHDKLQRMLALLERLGVHLRTRGADADAREAAADVLRYFDIAAPHHHLDEEIHLFPLLDAHPDAETARLVARLRGDHVLLQSRWNAARGTLERVAGGRQERFTAAEDASLAAFASLYREHLRTEDALAFPAAARLLSPSVLQAMGAEMQQRRRADTAPTKKTPGAGPGE